MVFGWSKKKQVIKEPEEMITTPKTKQVTIDKIPDILHDIINLRQKTLVSEIKPLRNRIESNRNVLLSIADELDADDLKTDDMDPHLQILVNRGKKEVITTIQNECKSEFIAINSFDNVLEFKRIANRASKKIGDMLGKHSRVIHIFAKKYAKKLKDDMAVNADNLKEIDLLLSNYESNYELITQITDTIKDYYDINNDIAKLDRRKSQLEKSIEDAQKNNLNLNDEIDKRKSSPEYNKFKDINSKIDLLHDEEKLFKKKVDNHFLKISRPLNKYIYISSLDKPLKIMAEKLAASPFDLLSTENSSDLRKILNSVVSGIDSGAVSVKDIEKSKQAIIETQNILPDLIQEKNSFTLKKEELNQSIKFDNEELLKLNEDLKKVYTEISDLDSRLTEVDLEIKKSKKSSFDLISKLELNLKQASSISYKIVLNENDIQN